MGMDWKRYLSPPWREREGNKFFICLVPVGIGCMVMAMGGVYFEGLRERLGGFFAGAGMAAGGAGTLALAYGQWPEETRFAWKVTARVGFLPLAPCFVLMELPSLLESVGGWGCAGLCAITVIPFGLSLIRLIWKKRNA